MKLIQSLALVFASFCTFYTASSQELVDHFSAAEIAQANTAKQENYLTQEEKNIFLWLNIARMHPKRFAVLVKEYAFANGYKSSSYAKSLYRELLNSVKPMKPVQPSKVLRDYAECHAVNSGKVGHVGHNRKLTKCPEMNFGSGECCAYGSETGQEIIMQLLIDHGVSSLGHRKICLNASYKAMNVAVRPHSGYRTNAVLDFAYEVEPVVY